MLRLRKLGVHGICVFQKSFPKELSNNYGLIYPYHLLQIGVVLAQCVCFLPSVLQEFRNPTALCFSILTPTGILFDEVCLADKKGSMLDVGQFSQRFRKFTLFCTNKCH